MSNINLGLKTILVIALLWACSSQIQAEETVFIGYPDIRHSCASFENVVTDKITGEARNEYKCIITKDENEYYWSSRGNKKLVYNISGTYHIFTSSDGSGYIKIVDEYYIDKTQKQSNRKFRYFENMSIGLQTITYWGRSGNFIP